MPNPKTSFVQSQQPTKIKTVIGSGEMTGLSTPLSQEQELAMSVIPNLTEGVPTLMNLTLTSAQNPTSTSWTTLIQEDESSSSLPEIDLENVDESYKTLIAYAKNNNLGGKIIKEYSKNTSFIDRGLFNITLYEYLSKEISESQALGMLKGIRMERQRAQAQSSRDAEHAMQRFITEQEAFLTMALDKLRQSSDNEKNCIHVLRQTMDTLNRIEKQKLDSTLTPKSSSTVSSISTDPPDTSLSFGNLLLGCNANGIIISYQVIKSPVNQALWKQIGDFLIGVPGDSLNSVSVPELIKCFRRDNPSQSNNTKWVLSLQ